MIIQLCFASNLCQAGASSQFITDRWLFCQNIMPKPAYNHRIYCGQSGSITTQFAPTLEFLTQLSDLNGSCWVQTTPLLLIKASPVGWQKYIRFQCWPVICTYIIYIFYKASCVCVSSAASVLAQRTLSGEQNKLTFNVPSAQGPLLISYCLLRKAIKTCFEERLTWILSSAVRTVAKRILMTEKLLEIERNI